MKLLVCLENNGELKEVNVNLATGEHKVRSVGFNTGHAVHVSRVIYDRRQYVALGRRDGSVEVLDVATGTARRLYPAQREIVHPSELFATIEYAQSLLYTCTTGGVATVRECKLNHTQISDEVLSTHSLGDYVSVLRPHPNQRGVVAYGGPQRAVEVAVLLNNRRSLWRAAKEEFVWISDVRFSNIGQRDSGYSLVAVSRYGEAYIYHTDVSSRPVKKIQVGEYPLTHLHMSHSLGGDAFYVANSQNQVSLVGYDGQVRHKVSMPEGSVYQADFFSPATRDDPQIPQSQSIPSTSLLRSENNSRSERFWAILNERDGHRHEEADEGNDDTEGEDNPDHGAADAPRRPPLDRRYFERVLGLARPRISISTGIGEDRSRREVARELRREERRLRMIRTDTGARTSSTAQIRRLQRWTPLALARNLQQNHRRPEPQGPWNRDSDDYVSPAASLRASHDAEFFRELWCDDDEQSLMYFNTLSSVHLPNEDEDEEEDGEDRPEIDRFLPPHIQAPVTPLALQPDSGRFVGGVRYESRERGLDLTVAAGLDRHVRVFDISQPSIGSRGRQLFAIPFDSRITSVAITEVGEEDVCEKPKRTASPIDRDGKRQRI